MYASSLINVHFSPKTSTILMFKMYFRIIFQTTDALHREDMIQDAIFDIEMDQIVPSFSDESLYPSFDTYQLSGQGNMFPHQPINDRAFSKSPPTYKESLDHLNAHAQRMTPSSSTSGSPVYHSLDEVWECINAVEKSGEHNIIDN